MNCQEYWDLYPELTPSAEAHSHAQECESCARQLAEQRALAAALRTAAMEWREIEAPAQVERGLVAAFRSQTDRPERPHRALWLPVLTWASAAAVLVALAVLMLRGGKPEPPRHVAPRGVELASISTSVNWYADEDVATGDFIPLPNAEQVGENEDVNVVRMEVPRSAMLAVGLPVSLDRASELVEADVMLGSDGLARAVRFVNE
jgi:anti-sigma-K factor RskA